MKRGAIFLLVIFMSIFMYGEDVSGENFFRGNFTDSNLNITSTKQGATAITTFDTSYFRGYRTLNINTDTTIFTRRTNTGAILIGTTNADRDNTLNITANGSINKLFDLTTTVNGSGNAYAAVISPRFVLDTSKVTDPNFQAFYASVGNYGNSYDKWPVTASISFGSDVIAKGLKDNQKFAVIQDNDDNGANASLWLNHKGAVSANNYRQNYWGNNIYQPFVVAPAPSRVFATSIRSDLDNYTTSSLGALLQISGDIEINGDNFVNARMYANFINRGNEISHYYGDMSGSGRIYASFIGADFKGNVAGNIGTSTGSIDGNGQRHFNFIFRNTIAVPKSQFDVNIQSNNTNNTFHIDNFYSPIVINAGAGTTANVGSTSADIDAINFMNLSNAGLNFIRQDGTYSFSRVSYIVERNAGQNVAIGDITNAVFGNAIYEGEVDKYGTLINTITSPYSNNTKSLGDRTLRYADSTLASMVSDVDIGVGGDNIKRNIAFVYTPGTFGASSSNGFFGYTGTLRGGSVDSTYLFRNAGYLRYSQVRDVRDGVGGRVILENTRYVDGIIGNGNVIINEALDMRSTSGLKQQGHVVGGNPTRQLELDFTGMERHSDLFLSISGNGYDATNNANGYYITNLKNVSTTHNAGNVLSGIKNTLTYNDSILGVMANAGIAFNHSAGMIPGELIAGTNTSNISADSKFSLRGSSISGNLRDNIYSYDFVFNTSNDLGVYGSFNSKLESSSYIGDEIDLRANTRAQKLHFIGDGSIRADTRDRVELLLGSGKNDILLHNTSSTLVGLNTAATGDGSTYILQGANVANTATSDTAIFLRSSAGNIGKLSLIDSTLRANGANAVGIDSITKDDIIDIQNSTIIADGTTSARGIVRRDADLNINGGSIRASHPTDSIGIEFIGRGGSSTISLENVGINANVGILANLTNNHILTINNHNNTYSSNTNREIRATGNGSLVLDRYYTKVLDYSQNTDMAHDPTTSHNNNHIFEITATNDMLFKNVLAFTHVESLEDFYLQDMVSVGGDSANWNPNPNTKVDGAVRADPSLVILSPLNMIVFSLNRNTGLVSVALDPKGSPSTTFSKIAIATLESQTNRLGTNLGTHFFNMSRVRYVADDKQSNMDRIARLKLSLGANRDTLTNNTTYGQYSGSTINMPKSLQYFFYESKNRIETFIEPYSVRSSLRGNNLFGSMNGYGVNGGVTFNLIPSFMIGWHLGAESRSGKNGGYETEMLSDANTLALSLGLHARYNIGHLKSDQSLIYVRGDATYQSLSAKQTTIVQDLSTIRINAKANGRNISGYVGIEKTTASGDIIALELGAVSQSNSINKIDMALSPTSKFIVDKRSKHNLYASANLRYAKLYRFGGIFVSPSGSVGARVLTMNDHFDSTILFAGSSLYTTDKLSRFIGVVDAGADMYMLQKRLSLGLRYIGEYGQYMTTHYLSARLGYRF